MNVEKIKKEIETKITGDIDKDAPYFRRLQEKYANVKGGKELLDWISALVVKEYAEKEGIDLSKITSNLYDDSIMLSEYYRNAGKPDKAEPVIRKAVRQFTKYLNDMDIHDSSSVVYRDINIEFERKLYFYKLDDRRKINVIDGISPFDLYMEYAEVLIEVKKYDEAKKILKKAKKWNPVSFEAAFKEAEIYKREDDLEQFFQKTNEAFGFAYKSKDVAKLYCNLGYYFLEKKLYEPSWSCYDFALVYDEYSSSADEGCGIIAMVTDGEVNHLSREKFDEFVEQYGFPDGYDDYIAALAYNYAEYYIEDEHYDYYEAKYYLDIGWNLTEDKDFKKLLRALNKKAKERLKQEYE